MDELRTLQPGLLSQPSRWFALIAKGDEVLSWQEMLSRYGLGRSLLLAGSDHAISDFERWQPELIRFLTTP